MTKAFKFGVVVFPGSNCDDDLIHVLGEVCKVHVEKIWHKEHHLPRVDGIFLPGGFSYGDYLRSGAIARYANIMPEISAFAQHGGFVWGICNGFQILCEAGLLPGALLSNRDQKFICENIYLKTITTNSIISNLLLEDQVLKMPIAHADGRYYADENTLKEMVTNDQIIFKYADRNGNTTESANINGSLLNIAGICNKTRNVYGMMPHPERAAEAILGNVDGYKMMESMLHHFASVLV
ncbi:MAG: phosphoribosylformylglycinamidine synthase subunit PurQ [Saprospiraceae bacterium]